MAARRIVSLILLSLLRALWWALVIVLPLLGVWIASSLATYLNGPRWLAVVAGVALFPGLPLLWDRWAEWRRQRRRAGKKDLLTKTRVLTAGDRLVLRTLAINLCFLGCLCAWYPAQAFAALATRGDWFVEGQSPDRVRQVRAFAAVAAGGLEWLYDAAHDNPFREESTEQELVENPTPGGELPRAQGSAVQPQATGNARPQASVSGTVGGQPAPVASSSGGQPAPVASSSGGQPESPKPEPKREPTPPKPSVSYPFAAELHPVVRDMPRGVEISVESVGEYIAAREKDPFLRVKALHDYVADRVAYDGEGYVSGNYPSSKPRDVLLTRKAVCAGYARLLAALGEVTGDEILYVTGDARVDSAPPSGQGHAWNAAKIHGAWYLMDPTWDSGFVSGSKFTRRYRTDYLFPPPRVMGVTHFPDKAAWQLRSPQLSRAEFLQQPVLRPWFFSNGLELIEPRSAQVTVRDEHFIAKIQNPHGRFVSAHAESTNGGPQIRCDVVPGATIEVDCTLPRGKYTVTIFAAAQEYGTYPYAGEFEIFSN